MRQWSLLAAALLCLSQVAQAESVIVHVKTDTGTVEVPGEFQEVLEDGVTVISDGKQMLFKHAAIEKVTDSHGEELALRGGRGGRGGRGIGAGQCNQASTSVDISKPVTERPVVTTPSSSITSKSKSTVFQATDFRKSIESNQSRPEVAAAAVDNGEGLALVNHLRKKQETAPPVPGPQGPAGPAGPPGKDGEPGSGVDPEELERVLSLLEQQQEKISKLQQSLAMLDGRVNDLDSRESPDLTARLDAVEKQAQLPIKVFWVDSKGQKISNTAQVHLGQSLPLVSIEE